MDVVVLEHVDELGEGGRDPDALLVLDALVALAQGLLDDEGEVLLGLLVAGLVEVHEDRDEGGLAVGGHESDDLILDGLDTAGDLVAQALIDHGLDLVGRGLVADGLHLGVDRAADLLAADVDEGREVLERDRLATVLAASDLGDDLGRDVAGGGEAVRLLDHGAGDHGAVLQHVVEVDEVAVVHALGVVVRVVEVDDALLVGLHHVLGQKLAVRQVAADLAGHVVALDGDHSRVLVGVLLLDDLVIGVDERQDLVVGRVLVALLILQVAIDDVLAGHGELVESHELVLDHVLDLLDRDGVAGLAALVLHVERGELDLALLEALVGGDLLIGGGNRVDNLRKIEADFRPVALNNLHLRDSLGKKGVFAAWLARTAAVRLHVYRATTIHNFLGSGL